MSDSDDYYFDEDEDCPHCEGSGTLAPDDDVSLMSGVGIGEGAPCRPCRGTGKRRKRHPAA